MITYIRNKSGSDVELKVGKGLNATRMHAHEYWSIGLVRSGTTRTKLGHRSFRLTAGEFIAIPARIPHLCTPESSDTFGFCVLYLEQAVLSLHDRVFDQVRVGRTDQKNLLRLGRSLTQHTPATDTSREIDSLSRLLAGSSRPIAEGCLPLPSAQGTRDEGNLSGSVPAGTNRFQAYRQAVKRYGLGPQAIKQNMRIEQAKQMLGKGFSVAETAAACGYYDQSHFVKTFRMYTGIPPLKYK